MFSTFFLDSFLKEFTTIVSISSSAFVLRFGAYFSMNRLLDQLKEEVSMLDFCLSMDLVQSVCHTSRNIQELTNSIVLYP